MSVLRKVQRQRGLNSGLSMSNAKLALISFIKSRHHLSTEDHEPNETADKGVYTMIQLHEHEPTPKQCRDSSSEDWVNALNVRVYFFFY